jgi:hypothetical protein
MPPAASVQSRRNLVSANKKLESYRARAPDMKSQEELDMEFEKINVTLLEARDDRRNNKDDEMFLQEIDSLKRHFPGV